MRFSDSVAHFFTKTAIFGFKIGTLIFEVYHKINAIFEFRDPFLTRITVFQIKIESSVFDVYDVKVTSHIVQSQNECDLQVQRLILPLTNNFQ